MIGGFGDDRAAYATALKSMKKHFGNPARVARSHIERIEALNAELSIGSEISDSRAGLRKFTIDIRDAPFTLQRMN